MKKSVGLFRALRFEDLDKTAELLLKYSPMDAYDILDDILASTIKGKEGRRKVINNLMCVWGNGKKPPSELQMKVMERYSESSHDEKVVFQILMVYLAFPFFAEAVGIIGKYLRMSDELQSKTLMNEIRNIYGITETVQKGVISVLGSLANWGILITDKQGHYEYQGKKIMIADEFGKNVLIYAVLAHAEAEYLTLEVINNQAGFFMIEYIIGSSDVIFDDLEVLRERLDTFVKVK